MKYFLFNDNIDRNWEKATVILVQQYSKDLRDKHTSEVQSLKSIYLVDFNDIWDILNNIKTLNLKRYFFS